jgi:hypothetical protein
MAAFQSYLQVAEKRNVEWMGDNSHVAAGEKRERETMHCCDTTASSSVAKVWCEVFAHFHASAIKCHSSMRNWLFGLPGRCQRKWWACPWLCSSPLSPFLVCTALSNHCQCFCHTFPRLAQYLCTLAVGSITKSHQATYTTPNKRTYKISTYTQLWKFCRMTPKKC